MPIEIVLSCRAADVKMQLSAGLTTLVEELVTAVATGASARALELGTWSASPELGVTVSDARTLPSHHERYLNVLPGAGSTGDFPGTAGSVGTIPVESL